jgi:chemotaxis signal transduction protein
MSEAPAVHGNAADLREAFDLSFASPPPVRDGVEDILTIRVAGEPYAVRLCEISGLVTGRNVVRVPSPTPGLLGLTGLRGSLVPVFGLASILGCGQTPGAPRWMILCGIEETIALAFADFESYLRPPKSSFHEDLNPVNARGYVRQAVSIQGVVRAVIAVPAIVTAIREGIGHSRAAHISQAREQSQ